MTALRRLFHRHHPAATHTLGVGYVTQLCECGAQRRALIGPATGILIPCTGWSAANR